MSRTVIAKGASGLHQTVIVGSHHFLGDEAKDVGGTDEGPDPYEYLLAALGRAPTDGSDVCESQTVAAARSTDGLVSCEKPYR